MSSPKQLQAALKELRHLQRRRPSDRRVLLGLATCWRGLGRLDRAKQLLGRLLAAGAEEAALFQELGEVALAEARPAEAENWFRRALQKTPADYRSNYGMFLSLRRQGKTSQATPCRVRCEALRRDLDLLEDLLTRKMVRQPRSAALRYQAGLVLLRLGKEGEAVRWLQSALGEDPRHRPSHQALAGYYERHGQPERAREHRALAEQAPPPGRKE
jgi:predicted Zn-dependent protease